MSPSLTNKLFNKYPKIFKQKDSDITESCMSFGFECEDGWYVLIDRLCSYLQHDIDNNNYSQLEAIQVKEKFGALRFYADNVDARHSSVINFVEFLSMSICSSCGVLATENNKVDNWKKSYWITYLCKNCYEKNT